MKKRIYIAYTGGTIGMRKSNGVYHPDPGFLAKQMAAIPQLKDPRIPDFDVCEYDPILDSSQMAPGDWLKIAEDIAGKYADYDGFIVLHGTDTMAYSASALSFMLHNLCKPVVFTGSQIPLAEVRSDAQENLINALLIASEENITEVSLYFGNKLFRGCRSVKVNADGLNAFASPNFPPLAKAGVNIEVRKDLILPCKIKGIDAPPLKIGPIKNPVVGALRLFPGISGELVRNITQNPLQGLVLETYGAGNGPETEGFLGALKEATDRGVVIVNVTQCQRGNVTSTYAAGKALENVGVICGYDMTAEAALTKLFFLLNEGYQGEDLKNLMQTNLRGELTKPL
ncbi:MAG: L-asparaginase [Chlamydiales bacterium]|jgi:L-asparaginase